MANGTCHKLQVGHFSQAFSEGLSVKEGFDVRHVSKFFTGHPAD
jgi:hypothetical protein